MSAITQTDVAAKGIAKEAVRRRSKIRQYLPAYLSIAPYYILFLVFGIVPTIFSFYLALQKWDGVGKMQFVGFSNFAYALSDPIFGLSILNTFEIWFMSTVPMLIIALVMAFLINYRGKSKFFYQVAYYIPNVTSIVAISLIFGSLFGEQFGLINQALGIVHIPPIHWLSDAWPMRWAVALLVIWRWVGYNALVYMAGLQSIPSELYEAARIDGANTINTFLRITIPLLRPMILFTVISSTLGGLTMFTEPQILFSKANSGQPYSGGVGNSGLTMTLYQYWQTFASFHYGYGAAISWIIFLIVLVFTIINWKIIQRGNS
jgi:cellobiose transport system permease protein